MNRRVQPAADVKVSAVIPFFNDGSVVEDALESVRRQSRPVDEIVVVDDGSTDTFSLSVLDRLEDSGIVVARQLNNGPGSARNLGVAHSGGEALLFLDSDDTVTEGHVELALATLTQAPADVGFVYPDLRFVGNENRLLIMPPYNLYLLLHRNFCGMGGLVDRAVFEGGFQFRTDGVIGHEDWDFFVTLGVNGIFGHPLHGAPLRYRRWGYSRSDGVGAGQSGLTAARLLHPELDRPGRLIEIKREWAPALSVIVPVSGERVVADQSCDDFEIVVRPSRGVPRTRGRWVLMLEEEGLGAFDDPTLVERVLRLAGDLTPSTPITLYPGPAEGGGWHTTVTPEGRAPWGVVAEGHFHLDWSKRFDPGATGVAGFCAYLDLTAGTAVPWAYGHTTPPGEGVPLSEFRAARLPPELPEGAVEHTSSEVERGFRHHEARPLFMPAGGLGRLPHAPGPGQDGLGAIVDRAWANWMPSRAVELVVVVDVFGEATLETSASPITASPLASSRCPARLSVGYIWTQPFPGTACLSSRTDDTSGRVTYRVSDDPAGEVVLGYLPVDLLPGRVALERSIAGCLGAVCGPRQVTPPQLAILSAMAYVEPSESRPPLGRPMKGGPPERTAAADEDLVNRPKFHFRHRKDPGGIGP
jgi:glycosyltransferase involved in cell wall biosynthesis